jgi:hypothetical protein
MGVGIGVFFVTTGGNRPNNTDAGIPPAPGSAVSDLQTLEKNNELYADFELLDDLDLQQNVVATPQNAD